MERSQGTQRKRKNAPAFSPDCTAQLSEDHKQSQGHHRAGIFLPSFGLREIDIAVSGGQPRLMHSLQTILHITRTADLQALARTVDAAEPSDAQKASIQRAEAQVEVRKVQSAADWDAFDDELEHAAGALPPLQPVRGAEPPWAVNATEGFRHARAQLRKHRQQADLKSSLLLPRGTEMPASSAVQGAQVPALFVCVLDSKC
jgi:hypothetical protein